MYTFSWLLLFFGLSAEASAVYSNHCSYLHESSTDAEQALLDCVQGQDPNTPHAKLLFFCKEKSDMLTDAVLSEGICAAKNKKLFQ